jgi:hypothetical protein
MMSDVHGWACIAGGKVEHVVRWDGVSDWPPATDYLMIDLADYPHVGVGWDYVDGEFVDNRPKLDDE